MRAVRRRLVRKMRRVRVRRAANQACWAGRERAREAVEEREGEGGGKCEGARRRGFVGG